MTKFTPYTIEEIRELVTKINPQYVNISGTKSHQRARWIMTWAEAEAKRMDAEHCAGHGYIGLCSDCMSVPDLVAYYRAEVLREIGWPEGI